MFIRRVDRSPEPLPNTTFTGVSRCRKSLLRGTSVAMYIVGQERRLVDPPSQVVAGVRTVTTKMDERCDAHVAALVLFMMKRKSLTCAFSISLARLHTESKVCAPFRRLTRDSFSRR